MAEPKKDIDENRDEKGRFVEGNCANPTGRPRESGVNELRRAIEKAQKDKEKDFLEHLVERAYTSDTVLVAIAKKLWPDLRATDARIQQVGISLTDLEGMDEDKIVEFIIMSLGRLNAEAMSKVIGHYQQILKDRQEIDKDYDKAEDAICVE